MSQIQVTGEAKIRDLQGPVVANSGVITALDGLPSQYVRGDGTLADIPSVTGGGASVSYYLNGSVNQGTFGGSTYYQLGENAITGVGTNFSTSTDGLLAQFITDIDVPDVTEIPSGNWNIEFYMGVSASSGALASFYVEIYKYDGTTFTLVGTNVATPEFLTNTTTVDAYFTSVAMPFTVLAQTDRIAIRVYASVAGKTVTMYTEDNRLCQVVTTFSRGMLSLNSLTDQQQYLTVGTAGTDFNIVSALDTHTFNIPSASATNRGLITTGTQTIAGDKTLTGNNSFSGSNTFTQDLLINSVSAGRGAGNFTSNTRFGNDSFSANTSGENNSAFGLWSLRANTTGNGNAAFGFFSLSSNTTGGSNVAIGSNALTLNTTANGGVAIGQSALSKNTSGGFNVAVGYEALRENDIQSGNVAVGRSALRLSIAYNNTAIGDSSMALNTTGTLNTALGYYSLNANTTGSENVSIGSNTLKTNTTGSLNVAVGTNALNKNTIGNGNNAIGAYALLNNTSGYINTALGNTALQSNTTGSGNVAVGNSTLESNTTGVNNVGIGQASLLSNTTGNHNTAVGISTLQNTVGSNNTAIGHQAGELIYNGSNNTIVGVYQGTSAMSNNVILADGQGNIRYQFDGTKNIFNNPVDLGAWGLTASGVTANSYNAIGNGTQGGYIYLKQGTTPYAGLVGANGISADGTKFLLISNVSIAQDKVALFDFGSLTNNTARTYTFPDASGTIALTSNLSSYVPYTGATSDVNLGMFSITTTSTSNAQIFNANGSAGSAGQISMKWGTGFSAATGYSTLGGFNNGFLLISNIAGNQKFGIFDLSTLTTSVQRTYTLPDASGTLALTSQTGSLTAGSYFLTGMTAGSGALYYNAGANRVTLANYNASGILTFEVNGGATALTLASTGAATFSSSVTANGSGQSYPAFSVNNAVGSGGTYQKYLDFTSGATLIARMLRGNGYSGYEANGLNIDNFAGMQIQVNALGGSGGAFTVLGGNVGIGTSSLGSWAKLQVAGNIATTSTGYYWSNDLVGGSTPAYLEYNYGSSQLTIGSYGASANGYTIFTTGGSTERMRITSGGSVLINTTTTGNKLYVLNTSTNWEVNTIKGHDSNASTNTDGIISAVANRNTSNNTFYAYGYYNIGSGSFRFFVSDSGQVNSTSTSIAAISDVRHKENIRPIETGLNEVMMLKPSRFDWKEGKGTGRKDVAGFIAQELEEVLPDLVDEWKEKKDDVESFKSIRMGDLIPTLVKAIQEQNEIITKQGKAIEELKALIAAK